MPSGDNYNMACDAPSNCPASHHDDSDDVGDLNSGGEPGSTQTNGMYDCRSLVVGGSVVARVCNPLLKDYLSLQHVS